MATAPLPKLSYAEYLALESKGDVRHEYLRGEVWAMAGGTPEHGRIQVALAAEIRRALGRRPCVVLSSDVRVRIDASDRTTYPDLSVVCGKREVSAIDPHAITNPVVIVEVLSESSERADRGEKFAHYRRLSSLQEYVLVAQEARRIEVFRRSTEGWVLTEAGPGEQLVLTSIDATIAVDDVYFDPTA
ncbi:Uma2 family endonuclease [Sandaracinus amylolyticus]|uniref:Uma2 family endonuclease n=1 Tax=Sandaracinus amylolyticus TaxID=927083 RepID=UPI001F2B7A9B|nr:Uma2 family endonuclease [Sandaracinus amylolyticus]UJR86512.1 Hypothetical protein I5071_86070 [Sandaracinus amylolyticus]